MSDSATDSQDTEATPASNALDLREAARKGVVTIDLGDVAPTKPTNLNPFDIPVPPEPPEKPGSSASEHVQGE
jgi:hypothetical protein